MIDRLQFARAETEHITRPASTLTSRQISRDTARFLANGGCIEYLPAGATSEPTRGWNNQTLEATRASAKRGGAKRAGGRPAKDH